MWGIQSVRGGKFDILANFTKKLHFEQFWIINEGIPMLKTHFWANLFFGKKHFFGEIPLPIRNFLDSYVRVSQIFSNFEQDNKRWYEDIRNEFEKFKTHTLRL